MYQVDELDRVQSIDTLPYPEAGAPLPILLADDYALLLGYNTASDQGEVAVLRFHNHWAHYFGAPNDEAMQGHPLFGRGLGFYGIYSVENSSWCRQMEAMNAVHRHHNPARFKLLRHFIITFHDNIFECLANEVSLVATLPELHGVGPQLLARMSDYLFESS